MSRSSKIRVCNTTERRKAELFNGIDEKIASGNWDEALENLQYLIRTTPNLKRHIELKLAQLHFQMKDYVKTLDYLQFFIPSRDQKINRIFIKSLICLGKKKHAIWYIARAPLTIQEKGKLFSFIPFETREKNRGLIKDIKQTMISLRCSKCTAFLFYNENQFRCFFCEKKPLKKIFD